MKVDILGTEYTIKTLTEAEEPKFKDCNGMCEIWSKEIITCDRSKEDHTDFFSNYDDLMKKVLRHELMHAFFHESGHRRYSEDEELVDCVAVLIPKMVKAMKETKCL